jgi:dTDP-4-dehydrorhamnose reductase
LPYKRDATSSRIEDWKKFRNMKILITGGSGMLASSIVTELELGGYTILGSVASVIRTDINPRNSEIQGLDVQDLRDYVTVCEPDFIFHLAAETDVDLCEINPDHAFRTNTIGTENVAIICQEHDIPMLYVSTAEVFAGDQIQPYSEYDKPQPTNIYGLSKLCGEMAVENSVREYFVVRAGWMIGGGEIDKKFVGRIVRQLEEGKKELDIVDDRFGSPTFTRDFAKNLVPLINSKRYGLYHMVNRGAASRYEIALKIVEFMGVAEDVKVNPVESSRFPLCAPRGRSKAMRNYKLDLLGMNSMPEWEQSLEAYIKEHKTILR